MGLLGENHIYSYSQLSSFDECKYGFYLQRIEGIEEQSGNAFAERGTLIHDLLDQWAKKILTKEDILDRILNDEFSSFIELHSETRGDIVYIPELEMKIKPYVWEVKERIVNISFDMYSDVLKTRFFEFSTGLGLFFRACAELQCDPFAE